MVDSTIKKAIEATPDIANAYQTGLRAMGKYSVKIDLIGKAEGSVDIDAALTGKHPNANRWDYAFGYNSRIYFVEVHSANTSEVSTVLKKLQWLKDWLNEHAPEMNKHKAQPAFYWLQSGKFNILPNSSQYRLASQKNLLPIPKLVIK